MISAFVVRPIVVVVILANWSICWGRGNVEKLFCEEQELLKMRTAKICISSLEVGQVARNAFRSRNAGTGHSCGGFLSAGTVFRDCVGCPEMVVVPAGQSVMGSPSSESGRDGDEGPLHTTIIAKPFAVGKYEVTFGEWDDCVREKRCAAADDQRWGHGRQPVININFEQAVGYTSWLSEKTGQRYRLLSEAEWEYSARSGSKDPRFWGTSTDRACEFANVANPSTLTESWWPKEWVPHSCGDGYRNQTAPVGSFKPNSFGLYDMLGNVWEWVEDCYNENYDGAPSSGDSWLTGDCSRRVYRGGSWNNGPAFVRSASRVGVPSSRLYGVLGFRVARTLP